MELVSWMMVDCRLPAMKILSASKASFHKFEIGELAREVRTKSDSCRRNKCRKRKHDLCSPKSDSMVSINSEGLPSPKPFKSNSAEALSSLVSPYAERRNSLMASNLSDLGGEVSKESALVAVTESKAATM